MAGTIGAVFVGFATIVQPWYARWGATNEEVAASLPGDGIIAGPVTQETHAVTIDAPAERVWPWLAQLGQDRGGFYSYDFLENLVGCRMPTDDVLRPDRQAWAIGDRLWMYPPDAAGGIGYAVLREYVPGRALAFGTHVPSDSASVDQGSWTFVLSPVGADRTRLIVRTRTQSTSAWTLPGAFGRWIFSPAHFVMERRMMIGLKDVAERGARARTANHLEIALWTATLLALLVLVTLVFTRRQWHRPLAGAACLALLFMFLTLRQPPLMAGVLLVMAAIAVNWHDARHVPPAAAA